MRWRRSPKIAHDDGGVSTLDTRRNAARCRDGLAGAATLLSRAATATTAAEAAADPAWRQAIDRAVKDYNAHDAVSRAARVAEGKFRVLASDFSEEGGEQTATLKLKRKIVVDKYADAIEALYS